MIPNNVNQQLRKAIERYVGIVNLNMRLNGADTLSALVNSTKSKNSKMDDGSTDNTGCEDDVGETKAKGARQIHCSECPRILLSRKNFIKHAEDEHGMTLPIIRKNFEDQREFDKWMTYLREERNTEFVSKCGRKRLSNGSLLGYLVCSKGGCGSDISNRKKTAKSLKTCAAYLKVLRNENSGRIDIEGCIEHTGHDLLVISCPDEGCLSGGEDVFETKEDFRSSVAANDVQQAKQFSSTTQADLLNCLTGGNGGGNALNSNSSATIPAETLLNFLSVMKQAEMQMLSYQQQNNFSLLKTPKQEESDDMIASSSSEILHESAAPTPDAAGRTSSSKNSSGGLITNSYVDVELERRKLAMIEKLQTSIRKIDKNSIDGAEVAMRFFLRELDGLASKSS